MSEELQDLPDPLVLAEVCSMTDGRCFRCGFHTWPDETEDIRARCAAARARFRTPRLIPEKAVFRPALALRSMPGSNGTNMTDRIGPIETEYAGHRFRSRLEARWAVVFDAMGLAWRYESQGFEGGGAKYLPDFYLPSLDLWVEVKGSTAALQDDRDRLVTVLLSGALPGFLGSGEPVAGIHTMPSGGLLLLGDIPRDSSTETFFPLLRHTAEGGLVRDWLMFTKRQDSGEAKCLIEASIGMLASFARIARDIHLELLRRDSWTLEPVAIPFRLGFAIPTQEFAAGRQARFEHGQSGAA